ncbi:cytochrome P450 [Mollisia scopiformis]|uniref:Cytochrome P450 n=1 Tax=Mollisia scopiformis TaxID=149040 RepID=A0A194WT83_MOLSC|nr:cytochrome P450 [Mollisia scopiformis]KUJ11165.1 cytochrome P450 [Mollisia scopiformis]
MVHCETSNFASNAITSILFVFIASVAYTIWLTIYRLYFSPISHIPGPKLAAASWWYEFYFQVIKGGQYFKKIAKLHEQYSPIVRITPLEVHIDDPEFVDTIYTNAERRDKTPWHKNAFSSDTSAFATADHDLHRTRRATLNPYFSKSQIRKFAPWIQERANMLCRRFQEEYKGTDNVLTINEAFSCLTADSVMEYSFADLHIATNFPILIQLQIFILPRSFVTWLDPTSKIIFAWLNNVERHVDDVVKGSQKHQDVNHATIFSEILQSKRPPQENSKERLFNEAQTVVSAGVETTAWTMSVTFFHLLNNPEIMQKLNKEIEEAWTDPDVPLDLPTLEALPYLTAVIQEGLRMAYRGAARLPRISPDKDIPYTIPSASSCTTTKTVFPSSHTFAPERGLASPPPHLRNGKESPLSRYMISFSKGSRNCLGMQLAYAELYITLANVVRKNKFVLWETGLEDVVADREFLLARPKEGSLGIRVKVV